jgi:hypothetical protein
LFYNVFLNNNNNALKDYTYRNTGKIINIK